MKYKDGTAVDQDKIYQDISETTESLFINYQGKADFYAMLLNVTNRVLVDDSHVVKTAGLGLQGIKYKLFINVDFWRKLKEYEKEALLIHEIEHSIYNHPLVMQSYEDNKLFNIAADLGINTRILDITRNENILPGASNKEDRKLAKAKLDKLLEDKKANLITEEEFKELADKLPPIPIHPDDYKDKLQMSRSEIMVASTDELYRRLLDVRDGDNDPSSSLAQCLAASAEGMNQRSDHPDWDELGSLSESVKEVLKDQQEKSIAQVVSTLGIGKIPNHLKEIIDSILNPPKPVANWKQEFRSFVNGRGNMDIIGRTRSKPNLLIPDGFRLKFKPNKHILLALDTSGSMSQSQIAEVLTESINIRKVTNAKVTVITGDVAITDKWNLKNAKSVQEVLDSGIMGRGGTDTRWITNYIDENPNEYSCVVYLTDLIVYPPSSKPKIPMLCLATSGVSKGWVSTWTDEGYKVITIKN